MTFKEELTTLLNRTSSENGSNTPDFILADYLKRCMENFDDAVNAREEWYGRDNKFLVKQMPTAPACVFRTGCQNGQVCIDAGICKHGQKMFGLKDDPWCDDCSSRTCTCSAQETKPAPHIVDTFGPLVMESGVTHYSCRHYHVGALRRVPCDMGCQV